MKCKSVNNRRQIFLLALVYFYHLVVFSRVCMFLVCLEELMVLLIYVVIASSRTPTQAHLPSPHTLHSVIQYWLQCV